MTITEALPPGETDLDAGPRRTTGAGASRSLFDPSIVGPALGDALREARSPLHGPQPGHVHRRGRRAPDHRAGRHRLGLEHRPAERVRRLGGRLALGDGAVRQPRRGHGRGAGQGPGRHAAQDHRRVGGEGPDPRRLHRREALHPARARRPVRRRGRRGHPRRRRHRRGHRDGRRVGHHGRVGPGHQGVGWRPLGGHRRHPGAVRPDRGADHRPARARRSWTA